MLPMTTGVRWFVGVAFCLLALGGRPAFVEAAPVVLTRTDAENYSEIFALQNHKQWAEANRQIEQIEDKVLMGYVLKQRYLDPSFHKASFDTLKAWLEDYRDIPGAQKVHSAARRLGKGTLPTLPKCSRVVSRGPYHGADALAISLPTSKAGQALWAQLRQAVAAKNIEKVSLLLDTPSTLSSVPLGDRDKIRIGLMQLLYYAGFDAPALKLANTLADRRSDKIHQAYWIAGLASWRTEQFNDAFLWFSKVAALEDSAPRLSSAGAYWAARAALRTYRPEEASQLLTQAAKYKGSFYGLVARRTLGLPLGFQWVGDELGDAELQILKTSKAGHRALALVQIGMVAEAEEELRCLYSVSDPEIQDAITRLSNVSGMATLSLTLAGKQGLSDAETIAAANYPIPSWEPDNGWSIDRALVFALARQESGFNPKSLSPAGAKGVMQIMPQTAAFIVRQSDLPSQAVRNMDQPETNLAIGQKYIQHLLSLPYVDTNLFFVAAAYNAGPGTLQKWQTTLRYNDDPLLFIESIPIQETRNHVEQVLTNMWMYYDRLGQPVPSLDDVAAGRWPQYVAVDTMLQTAATE